VKATVNSTARRPAIVGEKNPNYRGGFASTCTQCQAPVWVRPSKRNQKNYFCSKACAAAWMRENTTGPDHWRFQGGDVQAKCKVCQVVFFIERKQFNREPNKYCSVQCCGIGRRKRRHVVCEVCRAEFSVRAHKTDARFCSRACKRLSQIKNRSPEEIIQKRIHRRMTSLMGQLLRKKKAGRSWVALVGYDAAVLVRHLERQFHSGMSWANMGQWHIDHIRPTSSFSFTSTDDPDFKACWAIENLRPLWKVDNLSKGDRWSPEDVEEATAPLLTPAP
jgi:hypothetical protein